MMREPESLTSERLIYSFNLIHDATGAHHSNPSLWGALSFAHSRFGRLLCDRLVRKESNINLTATLNMTSYRNTACFYLTRRNPTRLISLKAPITECNRVSALGPTSHTTLLGLTELCPFR